MKDTYDDNYNPFETNRSSEENDDDNNDYDIADPDSVNDYDTPEQSVPHFDGQDYTSSNPFSLFGNDEETQQSRQPDTNGNITSPTLSPYYREPYPQKKKTTAADIRKKRKSKRRRAKKILLSVFCVFVAVVIAGGSYLAYHINSILNSIQYTKYDNTNKYISSSELEHSDDVLNILLIGLDDDEGTGRSRSDSMMLVSLDNKNKQIKLTSFLRDMWIEIPDYTTAKLNAACSHGGPELVIDTIEYNFKIDIDNYVVINFDIFTDIVNELGGIDVDVSEAEADAMAKFNCIVEPGDNVHLDGEQALWYARIRKCDSDFQRTERQREVVSLLFEKLKTKNVSELYKLGLSVLQKVQTGFTKDDVKNIILDTKNRNTVLTYLSYDITQMSIPADGTWYDATRKGQMVLEIDLDKNTELLKEFIYGAGK